MLALTDWNLSTEGVINLCQICPYVVLSGRSGICLFGISTVNKPETKKIYLDDKAGTSEVICINLEGGFVMQFSINYSTILPMLQLCRKLKYGDLQEDELRQILRHEDYQFEFSRYKNRVSEEEFTNYFLNLPHLTEDAITNRDLKVHHNFYLYLLDNLDFFISKAQELPLYLTQDIFQEQINNALHWLPDGLILPDMKYVFTLGIGASGGYVFGNGSHYDFIQLIKYQSLDVFCSTLAHETHHVGFGVITKSIDIDSLPLEALFYWSFAGEGLAVKYCNNAEGVISKSIHEGAKNIGLDSFTWEYLNNDFDDTMIHFRESIRRIRNNEIKSIEELDKHLKEYWMNSWTKEQQSGDIPKLLHFRLYSFGNDIWGVIHDCFGKDVVYDTLRNPWKFPSVFDEALQKICRTDLQI